MNPLQRNLTARPAVALMLTLAITLVVAATAHAEGDPTEHLGRVIEVVSEGTRFGNQLFQVLDIEILSGPFQGERVEAEAGELMSGGTMRFQAGDRALLYYIDIPGAEGWVVVDALRRPALYLLALIFGAMVVAVGGWRGLSALLGLAVSFGVLALYMLPALLQGGSPIAISVIGSSAILFVTLYLAHGVNRKTTVAIVGTAISLTFTSLLASVFLDWAWLSGFSDETFLLQSAIGVDLNFRGLLLAGIIIGGLGVLDDISISQTAVVFALRNANSRLGWGELYSRAMEVGRDHIASLVNTLVMAYAGVALPLLLLFTNYEVPFLTVLNREIIAVEVVRTLLGSIGLVSAVPITTAIAAHVALRTQPREDEDDGHGHHHGHHHH